MALVNVWHHRKVAEASAKPCDICYKSTTNVLITPDNRDFFYVCIGHTKDHGFCNPIIDEAEATAKKKKAELDRGIELIKQEYEDKMKKKKKDKDSKSKENDQEKHKDKDKKDDEQERAEKEKDEKIKALSDKKTAEADADGSPRIFSLQKVFYQKRLDRLRQIEMARRNQERMKNPTLFPAVPSANPP